MFLGQSEHDTILECLSTVPETVDVVDPHLLVLNYWESVAKRAAGRHSDLDVTPDEAQALLDEIDVWAIDFGPPRSWEIPILPGIRATRPADLENLRAKFSLDPLMDLLR